MEKLIFIEEDNLAALKTALKKELKEIFLQNEKIAVKLHMGEEKNKYYIKPNIVKIAIDVLKELNTEPFLFDSPAIYPGGRDSVEKYLDTAKKHGFSQETMNCPIIISDEGIPIKTPHLDAEISKPLAEADGMLVLTHVKGHLCAGIGGAIKNLGMGCVTRKTKTEIHDGAQPILKGNCSACQTCLKLCPDKAITMKDDKPFFDYKKCWGCGVCSLVCPNKAIKPKIATFDQLLAEGAFAVLKCQKFSTSFKLVAGSKSISDYGKFLSMLKNHPDAVNDSNIPPICDGWFLTKIKKSFYVNVIMNITKLCDCANDPGPIVSPDIGILLGKDIVAIDKASADLINKKAGKDLFKEIHKKSPYWHIANASKLGLGSLDYKIENF